MPNVDKLLSIARYPLWLSAACIHEGNELDLSGNVYTNPGLFPEHAVSLQVTNKSVSVSCSAKQEEPRKRTLGVTLETCVTCKHDMHLQYVVNPIELNIYHIDKSCGLCYVLCSRNSSVVISMGRRAGVLFLAGSSDFYLLRDPSSPLFNW